MKGVVLAGGLGTRLRPLTNITNKHLLPVYDRPMVYYPIQCMKNAGIEEIMVVTGGPHAGQFFNLLRNGEEFELTRLCYAYQNGEGGIADALSLAEEFADGDDLCVILGDNIIEGTIASAADDFRSQGGGAKILLKQVPDPERFGVVALEGEGSGRRVSDIIEKPANPPSDLAVIGIYFYDRTVFDICREQVPSKRGELEITDVNRAYLQQGRLTHGVLDGWWIDAGTHDALLRASTLVSKTGANKTERIHSNGVATGH